MKLITALLVACFPVLPVAAGASVEFKAGAAIVDITPTKLPVLVNGGMYSKSANKVRTPLYARAIALDDGRRRLAIVVVDTCMMPRPLLDEAKALAAAKTDIRADRMLISATHTHSAPSTIACLGTDADPVYVPFLREKLAQAIAAAEANLEPARVGWAVENAAEYTALRRWVRRPDRIAKDPFGNNTLRAQMHSAKNWDDVTGESGPEDPDLSLIALQARDGRPIAVLANFSMHYFSDTPLSADYYGLFCGAVESHVAKGAESGRPPFVAMMSHGCSGDIWRCDYTKPPKSRFNHSTIDAYAEGLSKIALKAYGSVKYREDASVAMAEARLHLRYRVPDQQLLEWARGIVDAMGDRLPKTTTEVYAREQIILHERQSAEVVVQALRIGDIAIATTSNETYALTGLKLKLQSPLPKTMVIELANGGDGYIPPPEQLALGGYNTWPARSAGLEVEAEPKITEAALQLLEEVADRPRRAFRQSRGPAAKVLLDTRPVAYWRLDAFSGPRAMDASGRDCDALYEPGVAFFLEGPRSKQFCAGDEVNRAAHFAGGRLQARIASLKDRYSVSLWFWNGMPVDGREIAGWMFSRGRNHGLGPHGDHVGLGGKAHPGKLVFLHGNDANGAKLLAGRTQVQRWTWAHVVMVRDGTTVRIHLNGNAQPEIAAQSPAGFPTPLEQLFFGGRCDGQSNWEGRLDEIAVFDRVLSPAEIKKLACR